jgi:nucleoside 2-deoxyribosyltransferase
VVLTTGSTARGGRHFETGYALARDKPIIVVGPVEHAFQHLSERTIADGKQLPEVLRDRPEKHA